MHVGSLEEDNDQQGLAHILEHMAFNGSANFAALKDWMRIFNQSGCSLVRT